ncbi:hypothetical protein DDZ14_14535 [Maritimibacter sp. 55A14]|uniref:head-tail connector protein n=1 Tax=Maritimibacter sp. 55A14 TaxID=2174844 RepID=UPI000D61508D|nr:head-tail connector protein [Maritimibacter sp. 55A14]PWE30647.1 hypothetical protein DDZ14_14535 [Maritimibacter sp. 55A14]
MMLTELTSVLSTAVPVAEFRDHLRLGRGFADDGSQDAILESFLRAAVAAIEARIGKVLIRRDFLWSIGRWREPEAQALPVAPVVALSEVRIVDGLGAAHVVDPAAYRLVQDALRPQIAAAGTALPHVPAGGSVELVFRAGYGDTWPEVPLDLSQAVFLLAAHYYEHRAEAEGGGAAMPFGVMALIEHYRTVRVIGGAR